MKIVVLDGYALNPGDISWDPIKALGTTQIYDRTPVDSVLDHAGPADVILTNKTPLNREVIRKLTHCKYIGVLATGHNVVNAEAAAKRGIPVTNVPDYATACTAQHVFAMILERTNHVGLHNQSVRMGRWQRNPDFCYWIQPIQQLAGQTMGIFGFGRIGQRVGAIAHALGMRVLVHTRTAPPALPPGHTLVTCEELFQQSDYLSLHAPLTDDTLQVVNATRLALMKPTAHLINCGRGGLVDEQALADVLNGQKIAGALLDVLAEEPPDPKNPLLKARNCWITPHQAWAAKNARLQCMQTAADNIKGYFSGHPQNIVNGVRLAVAPA